MNASQDALRGHQQLLALPQGLIDAHVAGEAFAALVQHVGTWESAATGLTN